MPDTPDPFSTFQQEMDKMIADFWENREMTVPVFSNEQLCRLPNILEVIDYLLYLESCFVNNGCWSAECYQYPPFGPLISFNDVNGTHLAYLNNEDSDSFILNRLGSKRFCLKPNLREHPFLYRGQKEHFPTIESSFEREKTFAKHLISNLRAEEFVAKLQTHPLFRMFDNGITLDVIKHPVFIEMNYYGLAQHYGFNTGLVDFTSDIMAAAFFATSKNLGNDKYEPYGGDDKNKFGVIYIHEIKPNFTFTAGGFASIGQQIYPRTGAQHGFFYQEGRTKLPLEPQVKPVFFRHDIDCARKIFEELDGGKKLFPEDDLSRIAKSITKTNVISGKTFTKNIYTNNDNLEENLDFLKQESVEVDWYCENFFKKDELVEYYNNIETLWASFCEPISIIIENADQIKESLLNLPKQPHYRQFFEPRYYNLLNYHRLAEEDRANKNKRINAFFAAHPELDPKRHSAADAINN